MVYKRELEAKTIELEAQLAGKGTELRAAQQAHSSVHQQKLAGEDELARARSRSQAESEAHVHEQTSLRARMEAERLSVEESSREAQARLQAELEGVRLELTRKLTLEQEGAARLRDELRASRLETERCNELRSREKVEAESEMLRNQEISRASISQMESKLAAAASASALELERSRKDLTNERAITQEIVTEAKQEAATAMAQTLEAREDALRWQRAFNAANTPSSPPATRDYGRDASGRVHRTSP